MVLNVAPRRPRSISPGRRANAVFLQRSGVPKWLCSNRNLQAVPLTISLRHDWTHDEVRALFDVAAVGADIPGANRSPRVLRSVGGANVDAAFDQDRRLPRGLRLLSAERPLRHRRRCREADAARQGARRGARRARCRRQPLLHGRRLALAEGSRSRSGLRHDRGRQGARARDLRDARHAERTAGAEAEDGRPRLLQPQPRHFAGFLRQDHLHPHL